MELEILCFKNFDEMRNFGATSPPKIVDEHKPAKKNAVQKDWLDISRHGGGGVQRTPLP